jgi:uncharacterized membrane protein YoaK (UPF0700 family)
LGPNSDTPAALLTGFAGVAAMAMQNALHRIHLAGLPPTTIMTGNTTQAALDAIDLLRGAGQTAIIRGRFGRTLGGILYFAAGCAVAAVLYNWIGLWSLAVPVVVGLASTIVGAQGENPEPGPGKSAGQGTANE